MLHRSTALGAGSAWNMGSDATVLHQLAMRLGIVGTKRFHLEASCHPNGIDAKYLDTGTDFGAHDWSATWTKSRGVRYESGVWPRPAS